MDSHPIPHLDHPDHPRLSDAEYNLIVHTARDRTIHLVWLYALAIGSVIGIVIEHYTRFW